MKKKKRFWALNILIVAAILICAAAFVLHYKNWVKIEEGTFRIISGIYMQEIPIEEIDQVEWVDKIPSMERDHGFSAWEKEKGIFIDSVNLNRKIYVFVDNLTHRKIKLRYRDSLELYVNLSDSTESTVLFKKLSVGKE